MLAEQYQYSPLRVGGRETDAAEDIQDAESGLAAARSMSRWFGTLDIDRESDDDPGAVVDLRRARRAARESSASMRREP
jgi:hypothetical protein